MSFPQAIPIEDALRQIHDQAQGVVRLELVPPEVGAQLIAAGFFGDPDALLRLRVIVDCSKGILDHQHDAPRLCLSCPREIVSPVGVTFVIAFPSRDDATACIASALCESCAAAEPEVLKGLIAEGFRPVWPDLRIIKISHEGGHA